MNFTKIPCGLPKVSFSRGSFVISVKIGVFTETFRFQVSNEVLMEYENIFKLSFGPIDLSSEMYRSLKRMWVLMFLTKFLSEVLCVNCNDIVVVEFTV